MACRYCGANHSQHYVCDAQRRAETRAHRARASEVLASSGPVSHVANGTVANTNVANSMANSMANKYRYRDAEKRREYMREYMATRRLFGRKRDLVSQG